MQLFLKLCVGVRCPADHGSSVGQALGGDGTAFPFLDKPMCRTPVVDVRDGRPSWESCGVVGSRGTAG